MLFEEIPNLICYFGQKISINHCMITPSLMLKNYLNYFVKIQ